MRYFLFLILLSMAGLGHAQCKTFRLSSSGDTLNCTDMGGMKQGRWIVQVAALRGQPAYEDEGVFINDKKEGVWRRFNLMGDPLAVETYKWGNKNGISRYFNLTGMEREESWYATNPDKQFDTIDVPDPKDPNKYEMVVVKNTGTSRKHGTWKYYYPLTGALVRTEKYVLDELQEPGTENTTRNFTKVTATDTTAGKGKTAAAVPEKDKPKPKEVLEYEKKNSGKKVKVRDGRTGG